MPNLTTFLFIRAHSKSYSYSAPKLTASSYPVSSYKTSDLIYKTTPSLAAGGASHVYRARTSNAAVAANSVLGAAAAAEERAAEAGDFSLEEMERLTERSDAAAAALNRMTEEQRREIYARTMAAMEQKVLPIGAHIDNLVQKCLFMQIATVTFRCAFFFGFAMKAA